MPQYHDQVVDDDGADNSYQELAEPQSGIYVHHKSVEHSEVYKDEQKSTLVDKVLLVYDARLPWTLSDDEELEVQTCTDQDYHAWVSWVHHENDNQREDDSSQ